MATHEGYSLGVNTDFGQVKEANKAVGALYRELEKVNQKSKELHIPSSLPKEINHVNTVTASYIERLQSEGKTYEANQQKVKAYQGAINQLQARQKELEQAFSRTASSADKNSEKYRAQRVLINKNATEINRFKDSLKSAQSEMDRLHPTGFDKWASAAKKVDTATDKVKSKLHSAWDSIRGGATVATAGIAAVGAAAMSGAKQAGIIQQRYREINNLAVLGGEKQKEVTKSITEMQRQGRDMSIKYGKSQQEIAAGYEDLVKRGYTTKQAVGALQTELQASVASGDKFSDVTTVSSQVLDAFGMRANNTGKMLKNTKEVVNELAYSADATSTGFSDLGIAMSYVGTAAKSNNISLAETASALGVLSNNGLESDKAGTALRSTINGLTNQINKIGSKNSIFTKLGIKKSEMLDAHGNLKSLSHDMGVLYQHIEAHSKGGSDQNGFFKSIFGTTGMNGAMILAKSSKEVEGLTKRTEEAGKTGTYVAKLAAQNMGTAQGSANSAKQAMSAFKMTLGNAVLPALNQASNELAKFLLSKDGEQFQKNVGKVVGDFASTLVNLIRFVSTHQTTMKVIGGGFLLGYGAVKTAKVLSFVGDLYKQYKDLAALNPKIENLGKTTGQLISGNTGFKNMTKGAKLAVGVSAVFSAAQIGTDFYQAATAKTVSQKIKSAGAGIGGILGGAIGGVVGGPLGAQIGVELGQAMGPSAAESFGKAFSGHAAKYFVYGESGAKSNGKYNNQAEQYTHDGYYKVLNHRVKGKKPLYAYDDNGYYNLKTHKYTDQRSLAERSWGMSHRLNVQTLAHPNNAWDVLAGSANVLWNTAGHIGDKDFFKRSKAGIITSQKGSWLDWSGFFNWVRKPKAGESRNYNPLAGPAKGIASWWHKNVSNSKIDWGPFDPKKNGLNKWLAGFNPQVHGKTPKKWQLKRSSILPKINGKKWASGIVKDVQRGFKGFPEYTRELGGKSNKWFKSKWSGMKSWSGKVHKNVKSGWHGFQRWSGDISHTANKWFKSKWSGMKSWAGNIHKNVRAGWDGFKKWLGDLSKDAVDLFKKPFEGLSKWVNDHIPKPVKAVINGIGKGVNWIKGKVTGKAHAQGGRIINNHAALVGEAGPELAYRPYANNVRLLGANGPEFTKVHSGEHILNARDTAKVMSGGLGKGYTLKGYASGTDKLGKTSKKVTNDYKQITSKSSKSLNSLSRKSKQVWRNITSQTTKQSDKTRKKTISDYAEMHKGVTKQTDKTRKEAISDYTDMRKGVVKQNEKLHDGVIDLAGTTSKGFGKELGRMKGYAHDAMGDTIDQVNKGISGIDKVLGQFGGNTSVIKPVKFAKGTDENGRLTRNTLAMVNDATTGPRQEALVSDTGELYFPRGNNVTMMIPKGWGVLNGAQTQQVAQNSGVQHFAKGSGVSHSLLKKIADKGQQNPAQSFANMFTKNVQSSGTDLRKGSTDLANNSSTKLGVPWANAMWTVINDAIGDGSKNAKGLLKAVEKNGEGHKYVWGAAGPSTFDCSGLVMYTLKHDYGIDYPHFSGAQYARTQHISKNDARMGDLVFWGPGDHVGVYAGGNKYFSAESPSQGIHMNTLSSVVGHGSPMFGRVKGIKNDSSKAIRKNTADKALINLAKRELGASALKWIKDKLGDEMGSLSNPSGDGVARWRSVIERAARVMHVSLSKADLAHILNVTAHESGGNPKAVNGWDSNAKAGTPSKGVIQFIQPTFDHYAVKGHHNILNGYDQYLAMFNDKTWRRDLTLGGWGPTGAVRGYAKGGKPATHTPFIAGEQGPELITADGPVKVDTHDQTKRKLRDITDIVGRPTPRRTRGGSGKAPIININFNGPIYGGKDAAKQIADIVKREIIKILVNIGDEFGTDPSLY